MTLASRSQYYRRIVSAYLAPRRSHLSFWHETPEENPRASTTRLGEYYMLFHQKSEYAGPFDANGIPMLDYRGATGLQYNPIAIAQWGLANFNRMDRDITEARRRALQAADWLCDHLEENLHGLWVWNHHFDWEYRKTLEAPWYSGLAQGQGLSLLLRAHTMTANAKYRIAAERAFIPLTLPIAQGGVLFESEAGDLWIEEYLVDPPSHILNGFVWALWGVFDYWLACGESLARSIFDRGVKTILVNLRKYDTGYWSLYELSGTRLKMLASPFYHRLHIVQLRVMSKLTGESQFSEVADRWEAYARRPANRRRAWLEKGAFKLLYY